MARKRVFQIQHGCLDITLYLGHWVGDMPTSQNAVASGEPKKKWSGIQSYFMPSWIICECRADILT